MTYHSSIRIFGEKIIFSSKQRFQKGRKHPKVAKEITAMGIRIIHSKNTIQFKIPPTCSLSFIFESAF